MYYYIYERRTNNEETGEKITGFFYNNIIWFWGKNSGDYVNCARVPMHALVTSHKKLSCFGYIENRW